MFICRKRWNNSTCHHIWIDIWRHLQWESRPGSCWYNATYLCFSICYIQRLRQLSKDLQKSKRNPQVSYTSTFRTKPNWIFKKTAPILPWIHISKNFPGTSVGLVTSKWSNFLVDVSTWVKLISPNIHQTNFKPMVAHLYWIMRFFFLRVRSWISEVLRICV